MVDLIRRWKAWNREDAEAFAMYRSGEITREEWIAFKEQPPVKLADLPSDEAWKLAERTGLLSA
jgi:hypothetical protein